MRRRNCLAAFVVTLAFETPVAWAQPPAPPAVAPMTCDQEAAAVKQAWAQNRHNDLANVFHGEFSDIADTWCRTWEASGGDRRFKAGDFGRTLFTGDGVHPSVSSSLVPGSGLAAGASFSVGQNLSGAHRMRLSEAIDGRFSTNGSQSFSGRLDILGSGSRLDNRHNNATMLVGHQQLAQLTYFGQGNASSVGDESVFALSRTVTGGAMEIPLPRGFFVSAHLAGLWLRPSGVRDASIPSIEVRFPPPIAAAPAFDTPTTYVVYGGGIRWKYPVDAVTRGYSTELGSTIREHHETNGLPLSFALVDVAWMNRYAPSVGVGSFSLAALASFSAVPEGGAVPFYLQPTLGGTDLNGVSVLRSFSDYRFRAPNRLAIIVEHEHDLIGPLGTLIFADWGQVAQNSSALDLESFHHSFGAGVTVRVGNVTVLRAFYAWGGGEGTRTTFSGTSDSFASVLRTRNLF